MLDLRLGETGTTPVLTLAGAMEPKDTPVLSSRIQSLLASGKIVFVIDLTGVSRLLPEGGELLVRAARRIRGEEGNALVVAPGGEKDLDAMLGVQGAAKEFMTYATLKQALGTAEALRKKQFSKSVKIGSVGLGKLKETHSSASPEPGDSEEGPGPGQVTCPNCRATVPNDADRCYLCGMLLSDRETMLFHTPQFEKCEHCGANMLKSSPSCPLCGKQRSGKTSDQVPAPAKTAPKKPKDSLLAALGTKKPPEAKVGAPAPAPRPPEPTAPSSTMDSTLSTQKEALLDELTELQIRRGDLEAEIKRLTEEQAKFSERLTDRERVLVEREKAADDLRQIISTLRVQKAEAEKKVQRLEEHVEAATGRANEAYERARQAESVVIERSNRAGGVWAEVAAAEDRHEVLKEMIQIYEGKVEDILKSEVAQLEKKKGTLSAEMEEIKRELVRAQAEVWEHSEKVKEKASTAVFAAESQRGTEERQRELEGLELKKEAVSADVRVLEAELMKSRSEVESLRVERGDLRHLIEEDRAISVDLADKKEKLGVEITSLTARVEELSSEQSRLTSEVVAAQRALDQFTSRKITVENDVGRLDVILGRLEGEAAERKSEIETLNEETRGFREAGEGLRRECVLLRDDVEARKSELGALEARLAESKNAMDILRRELGDLEAAKSGIVGEVEALSASRDSLLSESEALGRRKTELETASESLVLMQSELVTAVAASESRRAELDGDRATLETVVAELSARREALAAEVAGMEVRHASGSDELRVAESRRAEIEKEIAAAQTILGGLRGEIDGARSQTAGEVGELLGNRDKLAEEKEHLATEVASLVARRDEARARLEELSAELALAGTSVESRKRELGAMTASLATMTEKFEIARSSGEADVAAVKSAIRDLDARRSVMEKEDVAERAAAAADIEKTRAETERALSRLADLERDAGRISAEIDERNRASHDEAGAERTRREELAAERTAIEAGLAVSRRQADELKAEAERLVASKSAVATDLEAARGELAGLVRQKTELIGEIAGMESEAARFDAAAPVVAALDAGGATGDLRDEIAALQSEKEAVSEEVVFEKKTLEIIKRDVERWLRERKKISVEYESELVTSLRREVEAFRKSGAALGGEPAGVGTLPVVPATPAAPAAVDTLERDKLASECEVLQREADRLRGEVNQRDVEIAGHAAVLEAEKSALVEARAGLAEVMKRADKLEAELATVTREREALEESERRVMAAAEEAEAERTELAARLQEEIARKSDVAMKKEEEKSQMVENVGKWEEERKESAEKARVLKAMLAEQEAIKDDLRRQLALEVARRKELEAAVRSAAPVDAPAPLLEPSPDMVRISSVIDGSKLERDETATEEEELLASNEPFRSDEVDFDEPVVSDLAAPVEERSMGPIALPPMERPWREWQDADAIVDEALRLEDLGFRMEAYAAYEKALELDPSSVRCLHNRALLYYQDRNLEGARSDLEKLIASHGNLRPESRRLLDKIRIKQGEKQSVSGWLDKFTGWLEGS